MMKAFTPEQRDSLIKTAVNSKAHKGYMGPYNFRIIPNINGLATDVEDPRKSHATQALASSIYDGNPIYNIIALGVYDCLIQRINNDPMLRFANNRDFVVMIKGGNAYPMLVPNHPDLPFSDLDICIFINPSLPKNIFDEIHDKLRVAVCQAMSMHKKSLDNVFFSETPDPVIKYRWFNDEQIDEFKRLHIVKSNEANLVSPFVDKETRNFCSRNSFILANSAVYDNKVVRVEVPHFDKAERIPLRKSPVFCSYNQTIKFDNGDHKRSFELYRMRWNCMSVEPSDRVSVEITTDPNDEESVRLSIFDVFRDDKVTADFIDITIPNQNDSELMDFWSNGQFLGMFVPSIRMWVNVPTITDCIRDINKMLTVFDCPEHKREKRVRKMQALREFYEAWFARA
jgi:hypothetical protein